jgi:hypothetical protein
VSTRINVVPVGLAAAAVFTPPAGSGIPHAVIHNAGPGTVYLGQASVTAQNGLALRAKEEVNFPYALDTIYACSGGLTLSGSVTTTSTAAVTHGASTAIPVTATTGFAAGQTVQVGAGTSAETLVVKATSTAPSLIFTVKPAYDHATGVTVAQVTAGAVGTLKVSAGLS